MTVDTLTDRVPDREVQFLCTRDALGGDYHSEVHFVPQSAATAGKKGHGAHASASGRCRRSKEIFRLAACGVEKKEIALAGQGLDLAGEHVRKTEVVGCCREDRGVGRERQST